MPNSHTYEIDVYREGRWWMTHFPEIYGLTHARRLREAAPIVRDYISVPNRNST